MMTAFQHGAKAYAKIGVETGVAAANPHRLIEMLFDGAILSLTQARDAMVAGDRARKGAAISRAIDIVENGLRASLDHAAGDLASQLEALYEYMTASLLIANVQNRIEPLAETYRLLSELREAWRGIDPQTAASAAHLPQERR